MFSNKELIEILKSIQSSFQLSHKDHNLLITLFSRLDHELTKLKDNILDFNEIANYFYDGIYISDGQGKTLFVNDAYEKITGIRREDIVGKYVADIEKEGKFFTGSVTDRVIREKRTINSKGKSLVNHKELLVTGVPIFNSNGDVIKVVINNRDMSNLKLIEDMETTISDYKIAVKNSNKELEFLKNQRVRHPISEPINEQMGYIVDSIHEVAPTPLPVLLYGETGTGKDAFADEIYYKSNRISNAYFKINCAKYTSTEFRELLFGRNDDPGMIALSNGGTLYFNEVSAIPLEIQADLLEILVTKKIPNIDQPLDIRFIFSTTLSLPDLVKQGKFLEKLWNKINIIHYDLLPLRERAEDIKYLTNDFLRWYNQKYHKSLQIEKEAYDLIQSYDWPGNIRELENFIDHMVGTHEDGKLTYDSIYRHLGYCKDEWEVNWDITLKEAVQNFERKYITQALKKYHSINNAAKHLGISQPGLWKKCKNLDISTD